MLSWRIIGAIFFASILMTSNVSMDIKMTCCHLRKSVKDGIFPIV